MNRWQFAIDVGGTFTDCIAISPGNQFQRVKLLSSSAMVHSVDERSTSSLVRLLGESAVDQFWNGYEVVLRSKGAVAAASSVASYDARRHELVLAEPLARAPIAGDLLSLESPEESPIFAMRYCLQLGLFDELPPLDLRLGTTLATNTLLTGSGAKTALVVTKGFEDLLEIGYQDRPALFELTITKRKPVNSITLELDERVAADGCVLKRLDESKVTVQLRKLLENGIDSLAICLLHSYKNPQHELVVGQCAAQLGFRHIYLSHSVSPTLGIIDRAETTVADAYLGPVLANFLVRFQDRLHPNSHVSLMTSAGGLVPPEKFSGKDGLLSGPAGGVVGLAASATRAGISKAIGFDMGGTSTDVSRFDSGFHTVYHMEKNGARLNTPAIEIETIASGGGSICRFDGMKLTVGPESAGAQPGPACYGNGGPLTITDMNFVLGRIAVDHFPFELNERAAIEQLQVMKSQISKRTGQLLSVEQLAAGYVSVANVQMAEAIRAISIACGSDPREFALLPFGGAAPQHACELARLLSMNEILVHPDSGILSAVGIAAADQIGNGVEPVYKPLTEEVTTQAFATCRSLSLRLRNELEAEGAKIDQLEERFRIELRYQGQNAALILPLIGEGTLEQRFHERHHRLFGYAEKDRTIEAVTVRVEMTASRLFGDEPASAPTDRQPPRTATTYVDGRFVTIPIFASNHLASVDSVAGPCLIAQSNSTLFVDDGWNASRDVAGQLRLTQTVLTQTQSIRRPTVADAETVDPVLLEVFNCRFSAIASQMGKTLQKTASSINVKERLDFSCAIFTASGDLVANAPHVPVHLGAMSATIRNVIIDHPQLEPGDAIVTNDPFRGGSHLPDVTVVTPVFEMGELVFFVANRAHHAEIGGVMPGSMWPLSTTLEEEGVLIPSFKVVSQAGFHEEHLRGLLEGGPHPSRSVETNLADVKAQIASIQQGVFDLGALADEYGLDLVKAYTRHIQSAAESKMRQALATIADGTYHFSDSMDDGSVIRVSIEIENDEAIFDFTGSAGVHPGNLNANIAIVNAAVTFCLRCLIAEDIPLNEGVLAPVSIIVPPGILNARPTSRPYPAVVGGNVETSQRIVDVILGALGVAAASQGTMNNLLFGDDSFGYYETIGGGAGATPDGCGADAVHTHMTNTRLTDPEILEHRFPVRLLHFGVRKGSGGRGEHDGGDGVTRTIEFLQPLDVSLLTQRRTTRPFGLFGGEPGSAGENLIRSQGSERVLPGVTSFTVKAGDILTLRTPGGGAWKRGGNQSLPPLVE